MPKTVKLDASGSSEALSGASNGPSRKTLLVYPFTKTFESEPKTNKYLLETPKELKRKTPLLELPKDFTKKPKLYTQKNNFSEIGDMKSTPTPKATKENTQLTQNDTQDGQIINQDCQNNSKNCQKNTQDCQKNTQDCQKKQDCETEIVCSDKKCHSDAVKCHHCCCHKEPVKSDCQSGCGCQNQAVKVIFAPAMMPSIFGPMPGIPYIVKQAVKVADKVSDLP